MRLLLVDKNQGDLTGFKRLLHQSGFNAHSLWQGENSQEIDQVFFSGLVLVALPGHQVNQYDIMCRIRAIEAFSMAPILFCHACETPENLAQILAVDGKEFMPAELGFTDVVATLGEFLMPQAA